MSWLRVSGLLAAFSIAVLIMAGCEGDAGLPGEPGAQGEPGEAGEKGDPGAKGDTGAVAGLEYAGSGACKSCHKEEHAAWENSGHPYKINPVAEVRDNTRYPPWVQEEIHGAESAIDDDFFEDNGDHEGAKDSSSKLISVNEFTFPTGGWDDVAYVIGGYGWKARFIGTDGYIITGRDNDTPGDSTDDPDKVQFNFALAVDSRGAAFPYADKPPTSATYHGGQKKPYDCGGCHTTGWVKDEDALTDNDLSDNQAGLEGIHGTWAEPGVGCEACHGPSSGHVADPYNVRVVWDASQRCGECHRRADPYEIDTSGRFIRHHEQFEELIQGKHSALGCGGCHDAHSPVRFGEKWVELEGTDKDPTPDPNPDPKVTELVNRHGVRINCESCHIKQVAAYAEWAQDKRGDGGVDLSLMSGVTCTQCHMPKVTKSATTAGASPSAPDATVFHGDTSTHLFAINAAADPIANDGELSTTPGDGGPARPYISLEYACASCHADEAAKTGTGLFDWADAALKANGGVHGGSN